MLLKNKEKIHLSIFALAAAFLLLFFAVATIFIFGLMFDSSNINYASRGGFWALFRHLFQRSIPFPFILFIFLVFLAIWLYLFLKEINHIQSELITEELKHINEHGSGQISGLMFNDRLSKELADQIDLLIKSKQELLDEERKNEQKQRELVTNVSHDLRTPLTSIVGYLGLIKDNPQLSPDQIQHHAGTAYAKAQQLVSMVEDLFSYSQTQTHGENLNFQPMELSEFFDQLIVQFELEAKKSNITMSALTNPQQIQIVADPEKLARLFINLINNAFKYGNPGMSFIKMTAVQRDDRVELKVQNDGTQIPRSSLEKVFDRFYRADQSGNKEISGTGLGLAIAKGIANQHHGDISAYSSSQLTSFVIDLPLDASLGIHH
ncbi:sensor histidine kinase [Oenococcus alcoholitolerans]|uniref:sensor histidine kinase n=1 Tax=Oenococcus alcoholitolerans TaxID=931074 RepID=UPI003F71AB26